MTYLLYIIILVTFTYGQTFAPCASEGGTCATVNNWVVAAYCANNRCSFKEATFANILCDSFNFGDPSPDVVKECGYYIVPTPVSVGTWIQITQERTNSPDVLQYVAITMDFSLNVLFVAPDPSVGQIGSWIFYSQTSPAIPYLSSQGIPPIPYDYVPSFYYAFWVRYCNGNRGSCFYRIVTGGFFCWNYFFGDPSVGEIKYCDYMTEPVFGPEDLWQPIAQEGQYFGFPASSGNYWVRYGTGCLTSCIYFYRLLSGNGFLCENELFGADPSVGNTKTCYILSSPTIQATIPVGSWVPVTSGGNTQSFSFTLTTGYTSSNTLTQTSTVTNGFSIAVKQGFAYKIGPVTGSTDITLSYSYTSALAIATTTSLTTSNTNGCTATCGAGTYSLWQWNVGWQQSGSGLSTSINTQTCFYQCRKDFSQPSCPFTICNATDFCSTCLTPSGTVFDALGYTYDGCGLDSNNHVLPIFAGSSSSMTPSLCFIWCSGQYGSQYFGVQGGNQCYCGSSNPFSLGTSNLCSIHCAGDNTQICGNANVNSVYLTNLPSSLGIAQSSNFSYVGCGIDSIPGTKTITIPGFPSLTYTVTRALSTFAGSYPSMTPQRCYTLCLLSITNPTHFGVQNSQECYCTDDYQPLKQGLASATSCSFPCSGNNNFICGGTLCNSVYAIVLPSYQNVLEASVEEEDAQGGQSLPAWVIPVAVVGSIVVVTVLVVMIILIVRKAQSSQNNDNHLQTTLV